jgi:hypothetical protein
MNKGTDREKDSKTAKQQNRTRAPPGTCHTTRVLSECALLHLPQTVRVPIETVRVPVETVRVPMCVRAFTNPHCYAGVDGCLAKRQCCYAGVGGCLANRQCGYTRVRIIVIASRQCITVRSVAIVCVSVKGNSCVRQW